MGVWITTIMRIIAGTSKGAMIASLKGNDVRPTLDRVRESVFNILAPDLCESTTFLDLFAGSGANGLEALSRGVKKSIFVDASPAALKIIRENAKKIGKAPDSSILSGNIPENLEALNRQFGSVEIIYADPPYRYPDYLGLLKSIGKSGLMGPETILTIEHDAKRTQLPEEAGNLTQYRQKSYGRTGVSFYRIGPSQT